MQTSMSTRVSLPVQGLRLPSRPAAGARRTAAFVVRAEKDSYQVLCLAGLGFPLCTPSFWRDCLVHSFVRLLTDLKCCVLCLWSSG